jgi:hypothetical protein
MLILPLVSRSSILDDRVLVKGWQSAFVEPLRCILRNSFAISWEVNSTYQCQFTAWDDGSVAYSLLNYGASIYFDDEAYIIKTCAPDYSEGVNTVQITATHIYNETDRIYQHSVKTGTLTYTVAQVLGFYLDNNAYGFTYRVIGKFEKQQITDLGNGSGKDCLSKVLETWPTAVIFPVGHEIRVYSTAEWARDNGKRIDYLHNVREMQINYDGASGIINQMMVYGATKDTDSTDKVEYYFKPHMVQDDASIKRWGVHPGPDLSDDRFKDAAAMDAYAKTQFVTDPALTYDVTFNGNEKPAAGEIYRTENRQTGLVTKIKLVAYTWYSLDPTQPTSATLNNTAKSILDYQNNLKRKAAQTEANTKKAAQQLAAANLMANQALAARLSGVPVPEVSKVAKSGALDLTSVNQLPAYILMTPEDNAAMGLKAGAQFVTPTRVDLVEGLDEVMGEVVPKDATPTAAGLMTAADKTKLDKLSTEPLTGIKLKDASTGAIYLLTVSDGAVKIEKESDS